MKKLILIIFVLILTLCLILWAKGNTMREIKTEIEISASPEQVWNILMDFDHWADWSPIINQASGDATLGAALNITMIGKEEGKDGPNYKPVITIMDAPNSFRWRAKMMAGLIMTNDKQFKLEATSSGTRLIHKELFSGMMVPLFWSNVEKNVPRMLDSMNEALKNKIEKISK